MPSAAPPTAQPDANGWQRSHLPEQGALAVLLVAYASTLGSFPRVWMEGRTHGFVVALFCVYLLWTKRRVLTAGRRDRAAASITAIALLSLAWVAMAVLNIQVGQQLLFVVLLVSWAVAAFGSASLAITLPVAGIFTLALPLWEVLLGVLQQMTVFVNGALIRVTGLEAQLSGNLIRFPFGTVEVAESCAGLSYFLSAATLSVMYGRLFLIRPKSRWTVIAWAVALAIVSNWIRVFGLVVIGYRTRMRSPLMAEHGTYGWVIFVLAMIVFFVIAQRVERADAQPGLTPPREPPATRESAGPLNRRGRLVLVAATTAAVLGPVTLIAVRSAAPAAQIPETIDGVAAGAAWRLSAATELPDSLRWTPQFHGASTTRHATWTNGVATVQLDRLVFASQSQGTELIRAGNSIDAANHVASDRIIGPLDGDFRMTRQAVVRGREGFRLVWYWYRVAGVKTPSPTRAKLLELATFLTAGPPSELVAVSATCGPTDCAEASRAVFHFTTGRDMPVAGQP
jgi:EpsI family protein